jgi:hypothetical protein
MRKAARRILRVGAAIASLPIVVLIAAVLIVRFDKPLVRNILQSQIVKRTGMAVRIGKLDYTLFPLRLDVQDLEAGLETKLQKVDLSVARLEAMGDLRKVVRGMKPALETVEADGAVIHFIQKALPEKPVDYEAIVLQASKNLAWAKKITAKNTRLSATLISLETSLGNFDLDILPGDEKSGVTISISPSALDITDKAGAIKMRSRFGASAILHLASSLDFSAALAFDAPVIAAAGVENSPAGITVDASGRVELASRKITVSRFKLGIPDLIEVEGKAEGKFDQGFSLAAEGTARLDKLENAAAFLGPRLPETFQRAKVRGPALLSGKYRIQRSNQETTDDVDGSLTFDGIEFDSIYKGLPLHARASGKMSASGPLRAPQLTADVRSTIGKFTADKLRVGGCDVHIVASGTQEGVNISNLEAGLKGLSFDAAGGKRLAFDSAALTGRASLNLVRKTPALNSLEARFDAALKSVILAAGEKSLSFDTATLKGDAILDTGRKTMTLNSLEARLSGISPLFLAGSFRQGKAPAAEMRLETRGLDLPALRALAAPFLPERWTGWDLAGKADLSLEARRPSISGKNWGFSGSLALAEVNFNDPDFTIAGEGINPVLKIEGEYSASEGLSFKGGLDISRGESLWKSVFIPWNEHPLRVTASGLYQPKSGGMTGLAARFEMPTIGEVSLHGSAQAGPSISFDLNSNARLSLGPLYSLYTRAGVSSQNRMSLTGALESGLHIKTNGDDLSVAGKVALADTSVERPATKTVFLDIDAEIPVFYDSEAAAAKSPDGPFPEEGFVHIGEFRNPFISLKGLAISLRAGTNAFSIEPFTQELYGGRLELGRTTFRFDPKSRLLEGTGSLALRDLDISLLPIQSPQLRLTGKIRADFPRLDISPERIAVSGRGEADIFGGQVILRDLEVANPFTPGRSISLNIDLLDLNLKKLTDEVPFGEVTGIVRGEVRNLVITYRQPERFEFRIESVPRKGVPQTFSLKAVDNLTVLSAGEPASVGTSRFWMRFIRGFRYKKLGIVSTLRNDTFTLNGTIREGGVEYLVKKPAFFGINVINRMPEKLISFKEMTSRLKRVGRSEK